MKQKDINLYDIECRITTAMTLMKLIISLSTNDIEKHEADYCYHKLGNLLTTIQAQVEIEE